MFGSAGSGGGFESVVLVGVDIVEPVRPARMLVLVWLRRVVRTHQQMRWSARRLSPTASGVMVWPSWLPLTVA